jgi:hypothetical protein
MIFNSSLLFDSQGTEDDHGEERRWIYHRNGRSMQCGERSDKVRLQYVKKCCSCRYCKNILSIRGVELDLSPLATPDTTGPIVIYQRWTKLKVEQLVG